MQRSTLASGGCSGSLCWYRGAVRERASLGVTGGFFMGAEASSNGTGNPRLALLCPSLCARPAAARPKDNSPPRCTPFMGRVGSPRRSQSKRVPRRGEQARHTGRTAKRHIIHSRHRPPPPPRSWPAHRRRAKTHWAMKRVVVSKPSGGRQSVTTLAAWRPMVQPQLAARRWASRLTAVGTGKRCALQPITPAPAVDHDALLPLHPCRLASIILAAVLGGALPSSRHDQCCERSATLESWSEPSHATCRCVARIVASAVQSGPSHIEVIPRRSCSLRSMYGMSRAQRPEAEGVPQKPRIRNSRRGGCAVARAAHEAAEEGGP
ncbi:hypothetical protein BKA66DRAFT_446596 [Pyrenochaeta sp. MPI-SDFR-AT-0127]|nr:hypothetical protein BKA66DRAFT_446596 [Pyrenochaeta sp. MPI-SDFR-AT-0127]